ncbi:MAG TPA: PqqD family peptide modification chaperone [Candidatus Binatia bacterium]|nr:PqqD family peptide modification chaperone [Candidatus Binatia bacterium]
MTELTAETRFVRSNDFVTAKVDDTLVMMSLEQGAYYGLDDIGTHIWEQLREPVSVTSLCDDFCARFDVQRAQCQTDVLAFMQELLSEGMVQIVADDAG